MTNHDLRALRQQLESLSLAGLTHLPAADRPPPQVQATAAVPVPVVPVRMPPSAPVVKEPMPDRSRTASEKELFQEMGKVQRIPEGGGSQPRRTHPGGPTADRSVPAPGSPGS